MFHDELMPADEREKFHSVYQRLSDAVGACVRMFLWALKEVERVTHEDGRDIHAVPLMLMMELAEPLDGVAVLARSGSALNCSQLLRTALELQLGLRYILEHKDTYEKRCLSYEFYHLRDKLRWVQRCDPKSQVGMQLRAELAGEELADVFDHTGCDVAKDTAGLEAKMNSPRYADVVTELTRMKAAKIKDGNWYSLWNGPKDCRSLALYLKKGSEYEVFYRQWSNVGHGEGAVKRLLSKKGEGAEFNAIRSPMKLPAMCRDACHLCNGTTRLIVDGLVPHISPAINECYQKEIQPGLHFIESIKGL